MRNAVARAGTTLGILIQIGLYVLTPWGIYCSFHRYGAGQGVLSIFLPPLLLGIVGLQRSGRSPFGRSVGTRQQNPWVTSLPSLVIPRTRKQSLELASAKADLKKWIGTLPDRKRAELRSAAENYVNAHAQQGRNFLSDLLDGIPLRKSSDPSVAVFVEKFQNVKGLASAWKRYDQNTMIAMAQVQDSLQKASPRSEASFSERSNLVFKASSRESSDERSGQ